jgi:hypothetical protein
MSTPLSKNHAARRDPIDLLTAYQTGDGAPRKF